MADFKLTENQAAAVYDRSGTLLVAAAAGSGKTAILTKRILEKLTDEKETFDISEFLIVTFTKAATGELRARLYKELSEYIKQNPNSTRARRQLSLINLAKISTIHSFCYDIIKQNFEALSLPSTLRIGEQTELDVLLYNTLEELVSENYESDGDSSLFLKAVEVLSDARSDAGFIEGVKNLYKKLRGISEPYRKYGKSLEMYRELEECDEIFSTAIGALMKENIRFEIESILSEMDCLLYEISLDEDLSRVLYEAVEADYTFFKSVVDSLDSGYETAKELASAFKAKTAKRATPEQDKEYLEEVKQRRTKCNTACKTVFVNYLGADTATVKTAARETRLLLEALLEFIKELDRRYTEKKFERALLDYADLEQYTLRLLVENTGEYGGEFKRTALAEYLSKNYAEIYVDEYQDTNMVQDLIFRAISRYDETLGTETNRFLVGDIKQSIYRFRGAQPEIFSSYIKSFCDKRNDPDGEMTRHKIYLSNNFRCSESVIAATNAVFDVIMEDYTADDRLIYSKGEKCKITAPCELVLLECDKEENPEREPLSEEAVYIAERIKEMAYNPKYLKEDGETYEYSDFAILIRSANAASEEYRRAFRACSVPLSCDSPEKFFELPEVLLALCLLNCVDNPQRDIYTAGLMYSPLFGFTADELCEIRSASYQSSFYSCCEYFCEKSENKSLVGKVSAFIETIGEFRKLSRGTPTDILISEMFTKTGLFDLYGGKDYEMRRNIMSIYEMARTFEKTSFRGLSAFLDYLSDKASGEDDFRTPAAPNSVKLMSIHRSKGLEFPVVFLARTMSRFNTRDENNPIIFSASHGIGITLRDTADTELVKVKRNFTTINTPFREALRFCERKDMLEEEKRLLYVAMTRARDRLIITAKTDDIAKLKLSSEKKHSGTFKTYGKYAMSYYDFLILTLSDGQLKSLFSRVEESTDDAVLKCYCVKADGKPSARKDISDKATAIDEGLVSELSEALKAAKSTSPYKSPLSRAAAKISVSRLKKGLLDEEEAVSMETVLKPMPKFMQGLEKADAAERGTAAHTFMQFCSFENLENKGAAFEADRLLELGFIDKRMREIIDLTILDDFVKSKLYSDMKRAPKLYRERRFNLKLSASEFTENPSPLLRDEFILVQGVSDLYFEGDDGNITLVDFKTDKVSEADGEKVLKERHSAQLGYYKRAIEEITGKNVSRVYVYSFALGREIKLEI